MGAADLAGILRSVARYRLRPGHHAGLLRLYPAFVPADGLAFDIGAHVGDRVRAFRALGARVLAVEPGTAALRVLWLLHGRDAGVVLVDAAIDAAPGDAGLLVNSRNPTVSTLSAEFVASTRGAPGWEGQHWSRARRVQVTTLDLLIAAHGRPNFIKIDVEGHEAAALAGLSRDNAPPALSFEVVMAARGAGLSALTRAAEGLGYRKFRLSIGESHRFIGEWTGPAGMARLLTELPAEANSADVYAVHDGHPALAG